MAVQEVLLDHEKLDVYNLARELARVGNVVVQQVPPGRADLVDQFRQAERRHLQLDLARFESDLDDPELRTQLAQEHHQAGQLHVFGTPTFRFMDSGDTAYLRIRELPRDPALMVDLFERYRSLLTDYPYLETVKRPRNGGN